MTPMTAIARAVRRCAGRLRTAQEEFRMANFMYSLPEELRRDLGWPDMDGRVTRAEPRRTRRA